MLYNFVLFIIYLKFEFNWASCILSGSPLIPWGSNGQQASHSFSLALIRSCDSPKSITVARGLTTWFTCPILRL